MFGCNMMQGTPSLTVGARRVGSIAIKNKTALELIWLVN